ncbi:ABC transporter ATP-binding protein [Oscillospiraceae bacterium MB08-C2-2]|nr:ABC transporter ATP-binding protein [Oscillospiraceae bacterium MB08-C2-2]
MDKILQVEQLHTSFKTRAGTVNAVRGVSFELAKGEILGLVGESGSGKSVTAMSLMRLLGSNGKITQGKAVFDGVDLAALSPKQMRSICGNRISMIFQDPMSSLNPLITVGKQVGEMLTEHKKELSKEQVRERVLELFRLVRIPEPEKRYSSYPHQFSGGMRQRVMIAMALACNPEMVIADEPTTALDVTIQDQILQLLRSLQKELGMSVLFITHDLGVVAELCSRVLVMYGGMVMEEALIDELFHAPSHPYTLGLLESIPRLDQDKSQKLLPIPGSPPDMLNPPKGCPFAPRCRYARRICAEEIPAYTYISETHRSMCHLLAADAPAVDNPFKGGAQHG